MAMHPNIFVKKLKEYPLASHLAWEKKDKRGVLKLDWNEADVLLPKHVRNKLSGFINNGQTNWYPDAANATLLKAIARYSRVPSEYVQYFAGEDSALEYIVRVFVSKGDMVGIVSPTYDNFRVFVESVGAKPVFIFCPDVFSADKDALFRQIRKEMKVVYLVNPNNPTGVLYSKADILFLIKNFPETIFIVDEAYFEFSGQTAASLILKNKNLIVGRSFSKAFGLASFRLGYILASPEIISHINKIKNGKNISTIAQLAAIESLKSRNHVVRYVREVAVARDLVCKELTRLGFEVVSSPANFILIKAKKPDVFCELLEKQNVYVRRLSHLPLVREYLRVTIGRVPTMKRFVKIVRLLDVEK